LAETTSDWLTLTEASRLLGVHPMTLRGWVDAGLIAAFRTPGGHRRLHVAELRDFLDQRRAANQTRALSVTPEKTLQQVRAQMSSAYMTRSTWYLRLSEEQRARQRDLGQRLLGLLLQFVSRRENADHFLSEGAALAREYGRELAYANLSAGELARAFLFFRRTVVNAAYHPEGLSGQGDKEGLRLLQRINTFMDELLIATLDAYDQVSRAVSPAPGASTATLKRPKSRHKLHKSSEK
jgi:excisionase family DNA binding protein